MRPHSLRAPDSRAAWLTALVALACILGLAAVLLGERVLQPAGREWQCRASGAGAGAQVAAAAPPSSAATLRPQPPAVNSTSSLLVVLARHEEDIRWWVSMSAGCAGMGHKDARSCLRSICIPALPVYLLLQQGGPAARSSPDGASASGHHLPNASGGGGVGARRCHTGCCVRGGCGTG